MNLSNLPPGVTDADIEEQAGAYDVNILYWKGPGFYSIACSDSERNPIRGFTNHWKLIDEQTEDSLKVSEPKSWDGPVVYPDNRCEIVEIHPFDAFSNHGDKILNYTFIELRVDHQQSDGFKRGWYHREIDSKLLYFYGVKVEYL